ncbi:MAG: hypothetical protein VKO64_06715 [Candidatus Sericytochromatia bacterium]|nr:hypothetical protein [Candidatus Sericytochromatia bacterium]
MACTRAWTLLLSLAMLAGVPAPALAQSAPVAPMPTAGALPAPAARPAGPVLPAPARPVVPDPRGAASARPGSLQGAGTPRPEPTPPPYIPGATASRSALPDPDQAEATGDIPLEAKPLPAPATGSSTVRLKADVLRQDRAARVGRAEGHVSLQYQDMSLETDWLEYDQDRKVVRTDRPFTLLQAASGGTQRITGKGLTFHLDSRDATVRNAYLTVPAPQSGQILYVTADELSTTGRTRFFLKRGVVSTCEEVQQEITPHYHIQAERIELVPDDYVLGWNAWVNVNNKRSIWLPSFWLPLKKRESRAEFGQNEIEGLFAKTGFGYQLDPNHSGTLFLHMLQKKGPGFGVSHQIANGSRSMTQLDAFGLLLPDAAPSGSLAVHGLDPENRRPFDDRMWKVRHQQRLLDTMTLDLSFEDWNLYTLANAQAVVGNNLQRTGLTEEALATKDYRQDHAAHTLQLTDQRNGVNWGLSRQFRDERGTRGQLFQLSTSYGANASWSRDGTSVRFQTNSQTNLPRPRPGATGIFAPTTTDPAKLENTNLDGNLQIDQQFGTGARASWSQRYRRTRAPAAFGSTLPTEVEELEEKLDLNQDLGWASSRVSMGKLLLFQPNGLEAKNIRSRNYVDKLPELDLNLKPLFTDFQPVTLGLDAGRYFEWNQYPLLSRDTALNSPAIRPYLGAIARFNPSLSLGSKAHGIWPGTTVDLGGTGFNQRFYSTGDAAFVLNVNAAMVSQVGEALRQTLTYKRIAPGGADDPDPVRKSTTPFQFDALALTQLSQLDIEERLALTGKLDWTHRLSYDYQRRRYGDYVSTLNLTPDPRVTGTLTSSYRFRETEYFEPTGGKWGNTALGLTLRSTPEAFGGGWGREKLNEGVQLVTQLNFDPEKGKLASLTNDLVASFGQSWDSHWEVFAGGSFDLVTSIPGAVPVPGDPDARTYRLRRVGISRDLHDFILSFEYDRQFESFMVRLRMTAFNTDIFSFSNQGLGVGGGLGSLGSALGGGGGTLP